MEKSKILLKALYTNTLYEKAYLLLKQNSNLLLSDRQLELKQFFVSLCKKESTGVANMTRAVNKLIKLKLIDDNNLNVIENSSIFIGERAYFECDDVDFINYQKESDVGFFLYTDSEIISNSKNDINKRGSKFSYFGDLVLSKIKCNGQLTNEKNKLYTYKTETNLYSCFISEHLSIITGTLLETYLNYLSEFIQLCLTSGKNKIVFLPFKQFYDPKSRKHIEWKKCYQIDNLMKQFPQIQFVKWSKNFDKFEIVTNNFKL